MLIKQTVKPLLAAAASLPFSLWPKETRGTFIPIFMLHRFECEDVGIEGHKPKVVEQCFEYLRKKKIDIISIEDAIRIQKSGTILKKPAVAFSIDDGYWDHYEIGKDIFLKYDSPTTYFVSTEIIGKDDWMWDSKLMFLIEESIRQGRLNDICKNYAIESYDKELVLESLVASLKRHDYQIVNQKISAMAALLNIDLPSEPTEKYRYMSWSDVKHVEHSGMLIGPHSKKHQVLSKLDDLSVRNEIEGSWFDLKDKLVNPSPVFCYPIGKNSDYGEREKRIVQESGMLGAVTARPGGLRLSGESNLYEIPRYALPDNILDFKQYVSWVEEFKNISRLKSPLKREKS